jgi:hypothetical protein
MNTSLPSVDELNRLAKAVMQRHGVPYAKALEILNGLRLHLICPDAAIRRPQYQAALLTAVNAGKRAFLGGVSVKVSADISCSLPAWQGMSLAHVVQELGATLTVVREPANKTIWIGFTDETELDDLVLVADGWRGGFVTAGSPQPLPEGDGFALGGVFAAGLVVARAFIDVVGLEIGVCDESFGLSLWRPDLPWTDPEANGPPLARLPEKLWLLGLGHLGQAYLWMLGLLPFSASAVPMVFLHDYDRITSGNWGAGLLCEQRTVGDRKTRTCARWAERRGFQTTLIERPFDNLTRVGTSEPRIALCGFDSALGRRGLESAGFDLVVECGLGSSVHYFDRMVLHTFPDASKHPQEIWPEVTTTDLADFDPRLFGAEFTEGKCGILAENLARKPISASFVGVTAAALVVAELLRGLHGGQRYELLHLHLRSDHSFRAVPKAEIYQLRHAINGSLRPAA